MPTFDEISTQLINLDGQLQNLKNTLEYVLNLDVGYNLRVTIIPNGNRRPKLKIELVTNKSRDIDQMSISLVKKYISAIEEIRKWRKGLIPDFPSF